MIWSDLGSILTRSTSTCAIHKRCAIWTQRTLVTSRPQLKLRRRIFTNWPTITKRDLTLKSTFCRRVWSQRLLLVLKDLDQFKSLLVTKWCCQGHKRTWLLTSSDSAAHPLWPSLRSKNTLERCTACPSRVKRCHPQVTIWERLWPIERLEGSGEGKTTRK